LQQALADLDALIGLESVKELVREVQAFVEIQQRRSKARLATEPMALHMIFKGNPGTGKTTVARIFGRMFEAMGVLPKGISSNASGPIWWASTSGTPPKRPGSRSARL